MPDQPRGREGRRTRRELSRALAKEILQRGGTTETQGGIQTKDWILFCLAGVLAVAIFLAEKTPTTVIGGLILMFMLLIHPALNMPWVRAATGKRKWANGISSLLVVGIIVSAFGISQWPPPTARHLRGRNKEAFRFLLNGSPYSGPSSQVIEVQFKGDNYEANEFAEDIVVALFSAGWNVAPRQPQGVLIGWPIRGVDILYGTQNDKDHERLEAALKKLVAPDVESHFDPQRRGSIVIVVGPCMSCRSN